MIKNIKFLGLFSLYFVCSFVLADNTNVNQTLPTKSSQPLPSLETVNNIDTVLSEKVQAEITKLASLKGQSVSASSREQVITLEGAVETRAQADEAIKAARSVQGVVDVKSQLTIKGLPNQ